MKTLKGKEAISAISKNEPILVLLYMDGCGYCDMLKPAWKEAKKDINKDGLIQIAEIEAGHSKELPVSIKNGIKGYPTILVSKNGKNKSEYAGDRSKEDLVRFALKHTTKVAKKEKVAGNCNCGKTGGKKTTKKKI